MTMASLFYTSEAPRAAASEVTQYVVITPVRDEQWYLPETIDSVCRQTVRPSEWIIVDDGSSDCTGTIANEAAAQHAWIRVIRRQNRGFRKSGGGVVEAFHEGLHTIQCTDWDFLVKLDGDLTFAPDYFERAFEHFRQDPRLGIGGGIIVHDLNGTLRPEGTPHFHVRGATKIYKRACWEAIGGLWTAAGWDTIDEVKANMLGFTTYSFPEMHLLHHRITGMEEGLVRDRVKHGVACYVSGYHPLFVMASCVSRLRQKPRVVGALSILWGFVKAHFMRPPRPEDRTYRSYIRGQQLRRLFGMTTIWK
jgi:biofilm PGA synthesis N-glycosyltransferase PgaC